MIFALLTFLAAFSIEGIGTLVSVIGLSSLFGANPIIIALAVALDLGKLIVVSLLYKHWSRLGKIMKSYGLIAAAVTMIITSAGAAGYLSGEFQKAMVGTQESGLKVDVLKTQIAKYEERKKQIDNQIAAIPDKYSASQKIRLMNQFKQEQKDLQDKISAIDKQLPDLQIHQISVEAKAGPILFIAKAFNIPVEQAVKWVILMIIFVFDPLAVFLIIAGNFLWELRSKKLAEPEVIFPTPPDREPALVVPDADMPIGSREWEAAMDLLPEKPQQPAEVINEQPPRDPDPVVLPADPVPVPAEVAEVAQEPEPVQPLPEPVQSPEWAAIWDMQPTPSALQNQGLVKAIPEGDYVFPLQTDVEPAPAPIPPQEQYERAQAANAGMTLEEWRASQIAKLERLQSDVQNLADALSGDREQITLSSLGVVKPDPHTITDVRAGEAYEVGIGTGAYTTGKKP